MNPFEVNRIIKNCKAEGKDISVKDLSRLCDCRISRSFLRMSDDVFISKSGRRHHKVEGLRISSWYELWFYHPKKFSEIKQKEEASDNQTQIEDYNLQKSEAKEQENING